MKIIFFPKVVDPHLRGGVDRLPPPQFFDPIPPPKEDALPLGGFLPDPPPPLPGASSGGGAVLFLQPGEDRMPEALVPS